VTFTGRTDEENLSMQTEKLPTFPSIQWTAPLESKWRDPKAPIVLNELAQRSEKLSLMKSDKNLTNQEEPA
jgi:hypothetical protein